MDEWKEMEWPRDGWDLWRCFWGEQCRKEGGCKRLRGIKRLGLPFFEEESVTKNWLAALGKNGVMGTRLKKIELEKKRKGRYKRKSTADTILLEKISDPTTQRKEICVFHVWLSHTESHVGEWCHQGVSSGVSLPLALTTWHEDMLECPTQWILQKGCD